MSLFGMHFRNVKQLILQEKKELRIRRHTLEKYFLLDELSILSDAQSNNHRNVLSYNLDTHVRFVANFTLGYQRAGRTNTNNLQKIIKFIKKTMMMPPY